MKHFSSYSVLPEELVIPSVDDLLYEIGLCLTSVRERPKRRAIDSPIVIAIVSIIMLITRIINIFNVNNNPIIFVLMGDVGRYFSMALHWNCSLFLANLMAFTSQLVYYYNYKRGIKPTFVRVFQMMSGLVTPSSVGLYRETDITRRVGQKKVSEKLSRENF